MRFRHDGIGNDSISARQRQSFGHSTTLSRTYWRERGRPVPPHLATLLDPETPVRRDAGALVPGDRGRRRHRQLGTLRAAGGRPDARPGSRLHAGGTRGNGRRSLGDYKRRSTCLSSFNQHSSMCFAMHRTASYNSRISSAGGSGTKTLSQSSSRPSLGAFPLVLFSL